MSGYVVAINPWAGLRPVEVAEVADALARHQIAATIEVVDSPTAMGRLAVEVVRSGRRLAITGGDGTLGLVAGALVDAGVAGDALPVGVLPAGSGCDFLRTFGIPHDLVSAAAHLRGDGEYRVDLGVVEGGWGRTVFANIAQAGVGAAAAETAPGLPRRLGRARYPLAFAARLPAFPGCRVTVSGSRPVSQPALAVIMANGQFFAGGWNIAPKALLVDGALDVQIIDAKKRQAPALVPKLIKGMHLGLPNVTRRSLASFTVETEVPWPVETDGDHRGSTPIEVSVLPSALSIKI
jgi:diacylglycerol kinase (ATP)